MSEINETMLDVRTKIDEWGLDFNEGDAVATLICYSLMKKTDPQNRFLPFALNEQLHFLTTAETTQKEQWQKVF